MTLCKRQKRKSKKKIANYAAAFVFEVSDPHIRKLFVRSDRLIYQVSDASVYIIGFIHGSRNLHKIAAG